MRLICTAILLVTSFLVKSQTGILFSRSSGALNTGGTLDVLMYNPVNKKTTLLLKGSVRGRGEYNAVTNQSRSKIIFNTYRFGGWKLGIGDFENGKINNIKKLTDSNHYEYCGKFSPNGQKIVYQEFNWSDRSESLLITDMDSKNAKLVFENNISDQNLDWTKDSKSIVFTHLRNDQLSIYIKSIDGKVFRKISNSNANDFAPSTSKVENKIAFLSDRTGKIDLFVMDLDGKNLKNLTPNLKTVDANENNIWAYKVCWSPDGKQIVFNAMMNGNLELFIVTSDGTELHQITHNNDSDVTPFWISADSK
ncbi:MAG: PD40 domain-containing protein [Cyclobacteriaceae bacterium]|nr:PD40 domain-containing protein [Cyclobacteriaceae bacterium HetDA_MAG_MS6]